MLKLADKTKKTRGKLLAISGRMPFQFVEAYKSLRTNIQFLSMNRQYHKILITSSVSGEGKSTVAINLAIALANSESRVLLIDCDLRDPMIQEYLHIESDTGLANAIAGLEKIDQCIVPVSELGISVIPSGPVSPNPTEMLGSRKMEEIVEELSGRFEYIIFDTPPVSVVTDAAVLSKITDGVIFVIKQNSTTIRAAQTALNNLKNVGAVPIGGVLNAFAVKKSGKV